MAAVLRDTGRPLADAMSVPAFAAREFRGALSTFATGVTIVTARAPNGDAIGLTANSFNSVSLDPALVLWSLSMKARSMSVFTTVSHYAINVLTADQIDLAQRFACCTTDRFAGVRVRDGLHAVPLIEGAAAVFECASRSRYEEGDHVIFVGEVQRCDHLLGARPLVFHRGRYVTELPGN
jgi:flavin reductase (DIM6/NTAB) family NADH-FMN oxidoreductase RutF